ncbi:hypothetical protein Leryth_015344 [Lithospermum erythrorhizon]|nr:hypothetical protein Leryth_015344 [Lithospermum erythrorhizon]
MEVEREEKCHITLNNEAIVAVPNLAVAIPYTSWGAFPYEFSAIATYLQTIAIISSICLVSHEP